MLVEYAYTRADSCVGSNIEIGSLSVSMLIQGLNAKGGTETALWLLRGHSHQLYSKISQVKTMHEKPACVQT